ncbi:MAG: hypothetical protein RIQ56_311, partial [Candidatus Parcubacteria bacterium]
MLEIIIGLVVGIALGAGGFIVRRYLKRQAILQSLSFILYLVKVPRERTMEDDERKDFKTEIGKFEQLLANLLSLRAPFVFEVAVPHVGEEIHFYLGAPRQVGDIAVKQVQGIWNGASVERATDDYNVFNPSGVHAAAYLQQKQNYALPVRTYNEIGSDTFSSIVGGFVRVNEVGEGAALQLVVHPPQVSEQKKILTFIEALKKGTPLRKVLGAELPVSAREMGETMNPFAKTKTEKEQKEGRVVDDEAVKILETKSSKPLFEVNVRCIASAPSEAQAVSILEGILAGFRQFGSARRNEFRAVKPRNGKQLLTQYILREFNDRQAMVLNSEEIASFYHLPISTTETPKIKWLKSREAAPPANLPGEGVCIGESVFRGQAKPVYLTDDDRRRHLYIVGQTGTGKSTLMRQMIVDDISRGKGVAMIDPHGDLVEWVLGLIPPERFDDVIYFDPGDRLKPLGLNMLDYNRERPEEKTFIVNEMQSIFNKLFPPETMGPMFEQYMRNALLLLMEDMPNEPATLVEVP